MMENIIWSDNTHGDASKKYLASQDHGTWFGTEVEITKVSVKIQSEALR